MVEKIRPMSIEEFVRLYEEEGPFEFVNGERIPMSPPVANHSTIATLLVVALYNYGLEKGVGMALMETTFVMVDEPGWVKGSRVPDVMFIGAGRLAAYKAQTPDWKDKPFVLVPDLAVEIVSPGDRYTEVQEKVESYLRDGVQVVWVIDPHRRSVTVSVAGSKQQTTLSDEDRLDGGEVIPGFSLPVAALFE